MSEKEELNQILRDHPELVTPTLILLGVLMREYEAQAEAGRKYH